MVNMKKRYAGAMRFPVFFIIVISFLLVQCDFFSQLIGSTPNLTSIDITPADPEIEIGTILQFSATGYHNDGSIRPLLPGEVTWSSSDTIIATVSALGMATGTSPGSTIITATSATLSDVSGTTMLTIIDQPSDPKITVAPIIGLVTTEDGGIDAFTVVLNTQPSVDVVVGLSSGNTAEGTVSPASLTFTDSNWSTAQTATVTGVDDEIADGNQIYTIIVAAAVSTDTNYSGLNPDDVTVTNSDNDDDVVGGEWGVTKWAESLWGNP